MLDSLENFLRLSDAVERQETVTQIQSGVVFDLGICRFDLLCEREALPILEAERPAGMQRFAERGVLRADLSLEEARDTLWTLNSLAVHDLLVVQRGWSAERYRDWLFRLR